MIEAAAVVACIGIYFITLRKQPGRASFDWVKFWAMLGMFAVFMVGFELPLILSKRLQAEHPLVFFALSLGGMVAFVLAITMWGLQRKKMREAA